MGTRFDEVYSYALTVIKDYQLDKLAKDNFDAFLLYWENILITVIPDFDGCLKSLDYEYLIEQPTTEGEKKIPCFKETLDIKEKSILGKLMVIGWFTGKVQDVIQFQGKLSTRDFKTFSEANNLKEKNNYLNGLIEKYEQEVTDYQLQHLEELPYFKDFV